MRIIFCLAALFVLNSRVLSQQQNNVQPSISHDYLKKSKAQKKAGWVLLAGGTVLIATAAIIPRGDLKYDGITIGPYSSDKYGNDGIKSGFLIAGGITALSSIPFFIMSHKNQKRATSISLKMEKTGYIYNRNLANTSFPAVRMKMNF